MTARIPAEPDSERLAELDPELRTLPAGSLLWRVYFRAGAHPTRWRDFRHYGPADARFDHHRDLRPGLQAQAVMYLAESPTTCLAEVFQKTRVIHRESRQPWLVGLRLAAAVDLLDLSGAFPTRAGASMGLMSGPRSVGRNWARGFHRAYPAIHGLSYPSSMHANRPALVLNERAEAAGVIPVIPQFHRALADPALLAVLKNAALDIGFALG
ncbi:MAG: RES family NAD+ phosphorylase [Pseudomonadota bacterium]|nr:RES family NAD+ phosphorylase [Pseudomonadota bacterium]